MKSFKQILSEVAIAKSPADKEFIALHAIKKSQRVAYPETQFKGGTRKDHSKSAGPSNATGMEDDVGGEKPVHEEEQLDEISKKTLGSYITRAASDARTHSSIAASTAMQAIDDKHAGRYADHDRWKKISKDSEDRSHRRQMGIVKATTKLTKEEMDAMSFDELAEHNLMEISKKTLGSYIKKATSEVGFHMADHARQSTRAIDNSVPHDERVKERTAASKNYDKAVKRYQGVKKATDKLTK